MATSIIEIIIRSAEKPTLPPVVSPELPKTLDLKVGETFALAPFVSDPQGYPLTYTLTPGGSGNALIAVSKDGVITAIKVGEGTASITIDNGH